MFSGLLCILILVSIGNNNGDYFEKQKNIQPGKMIEKAVVNSLVQCLNMCSQLEKKCNLVNYGKSECELLWADFTDDLYLLSESTDKEQYKKVNTSLLPRGFCTYALGFFQLSLVFLHFHIFVLNYLQKMASANKKGPA